MSCRSCASNLDSFCDGLLVAVQLLLCGVLPPGLIQYCSQHSCVVAVKLFLQPFTLYSSIDTIAAWKKLRFILSVRSDFLMTNILLIALHAFVSHVLMSFSVNETLCHIQPMAEQLVLRRHVPSGLAGCCSFPPSPPVNAGHRCWLWFAECYLVLQISPTPKRNHIL